MDLFAGISLGRWFGIKVVLSYLFLIYAAINLFGPGESPEGLQFNAMFMGILFAVVLLHEFGHALACLAVGGHADHIVLWPLGGLAFVQPPNRPWPNIITTACGPLVNLVLWILFYFLNQYVIWPNFYLFQIAFILQEINFGLLMFNLIPAYPMDGGRLLQEILWLFLGLGRSMMIAGMVGTVAGASFICMGMGLFSITIPHVITLGYDRHNPNAQPENTLIYIGIMCAMSSFSLYRRSQEMSNWRKN